MYYSCPRIHSWHAERHRRLSWFSTPWPSRNSLLQNARKVSIFFYRHCHPESYISCSSVVPKHLVSVYITSDFERPVVYIFVIFFFTTLPLWLSWCDNLKLLCDYLSDLLRNRKPHSWRYIGLAVEFFTEQHPLSTSFQTTLATAMLA